MSGATDDSRDIEKLYEKLNEAKDKSQNKKDYEGIIAAANGSVKAKQLAAQMIPEFFKYFPDISEQALDQHLYLCKVEEHDVRVQAICRLPLFCKDTHEHLAKIVDFLGQLLIAGDNVERDAVHEALMSLLRQDVKTSLTALFKHLGSANDRNAKDLSASESIREKVLCFIRDKVFPLKEELLNPKDEMKRHINNLVEQNLQATDVEYNLFIDFLKSLSFELVPHAQLALAGISDDKLVKMLTQAKGFLNDPPRGMDAGKLAMLRGYVELYELELQRRVVAVDNIDEPPVPMEKDDPQTNKPPSPVAVTEEDPNFMAKKTESELFYMLQSINVVVESKSSELFEGGKDLYIIGKKIEEELNRRKKRGFGDGAWGFSAPRKARTPREVIGVIGNQSNSKMLETNKGSKETALNPHKGKNVVDLVNQVENVVDQVKDAVIYYTSDHRFTRIQEREFDNVHIRYSMLELNLSSNALLADEMLKFYINFLQRPSVSYASLLPQCYFFDPFFYSAWESLKGNEEPASKFVEMTKAWIKDLNIFEKQFLFMPIHGGAHWSLAIVCMATKERERAIVFMHLDSYMCHDSEKVFVNLEEFLSQESRRLKMGRLPRIVKLTPRVPQQQNGRDCGFFLLHFMEQFLHVIHRNKGALTVELLRDNVFCDEGFSSVTAENLRHEMRNLLECQFKILQLK